MSVQVPGKEMKLPITADNLAIWVALACALAACVAYVVAWPTRRKDAPSSAASTARMLYYVSVGATLAASLYLMQCILSGNRFDIAYVYEHSSVRDGLLYRISSFWAGQQGSLLLWALLIGLVGLPIAKRLSGTSPLAMAFWCSVTSFLLALLVIDDPMRRFATSQPVLDGLGLNPLLKNPWMVIHPPVIFLGYALLCVPAAFAVQGLIEGDSERWARLCQPWALAGWTLMTAGLVLGMIWSYDVLGWGGYWGWDPVENASLVPWLFATALIHGLVFQRERRRNAAWNVVFAFATFLSVLYASYLTRSGVLAGGASVHAFGDTSSYSEMPIYLWLKWTPIAYVVLFVLLLATRRRVLPRSKGALETTSRDLALAVGLVVVCLFAAMVLVGTTYTTFAAKADLRPSFYTRMSIPLTIAILVLIALSPLLKWGGEKGHWSENLALWSGVAALAIVAGLAIVVGIVCLASQNATRTLFGWLLPEMRPGAHVPPLVPFGLFLMLGLSAVALLANWIPMTRLSLARCGAYLAHAGVALMIVGMIFSTAGRSKVLVLRSDDVPKRAFGTAYSFKSIRAGDNGKQEIIVIAERNGKQIAVPLSYSQTREGTIFFPHARSHFLSDLYIAPERINFDPITLKMVRQGGQLVSKPVPIPGTVATLALTGMTVETREVSLQYTKPGAKPVKMLVSQDKPTEVDGYALTFMNFVGGRAHGTMPEEVGASIGITGNGFGEVRIRVSTKPLINLLWIGTLLIFTGGNLAWDRRREENRA